MAIKKPIAKRLKEIADRLPLVWNTEQDYVWMTAAELRLTPLDSPDLDDSKEYQIPIPKYVAVYHEQQVKDAYKRGGAKAVAQYVKEVTECAS